MPEAEKKFGTKVTTEGSALIASCALEGTKLQITQAAAGDGGGAYYEPTVDQAALKNEKWRGEIASAEISSLSPNMIDVKVVIPDEVGGFTIREMAVFDNAGHMIAVCNTPDTEKVSISGGISGKLTMLMHIIVADTSVLEFTITPSLDTVSAEELQEAVSNHNTDESSHTDIRSALSNKAPAGFGLGGVTPVAEGTDLDDLVNTGWYYVTASTIHRPDYLSVSCICMVMSRNANPQTIQIVYDVASPYGVARRVNTNGVWSPWEYVNPPLQIGVEYRTVERYLGKPIYVKALSLGALPNNGQKLVNHGVENMDYCLSLTGTAANYNILGFNGVESVFCGITAISVETNSDQTSREGIAVIRYTKSTD